MLQTEKSKCRDPKAGYAGHIPKPVKEPVCMGPRKIVGDDVIEIARGQIMLVSMGHGFYQVLL